MVYSEATRGGAYGYSCELQINDSNQCCQQRPAANDTVCDGEHYSQYKTDGDWNDLPIVGSSSGVYQTKGYIIEFSTNFVSTNTCGNANADQRAACVNYLLEENIVLKDFTYTDEDMLDICDITP